MNTLRVLPHRAKAAIVEVAKTRASARALKQLLVIVAGVLVALAANSWYSRQQDRSLERYYLLQLRSDVEVDSAQFAFIGRLLHVKVEALALLEESFLYGRANASDTAVVRAMIQAEVLSTALPAVRDDTYRELNATGRLALIRNAALRAQIVRYYSRVQEERLREEGRRTGYTAATSSLIPYAARRRIDDYGMVSAIAVQRPGFSMYRTDAAEGGPDLEDAASEAVAAARQSEFWRQINAERAHAAFLESMLTRLDEVGLQYLTVLDAELRRRSQ
jgi:hypothetical protein